MTSDARLAVVAVGGNALIVDESRKSIPDQFQAAAATTRSIVDLMESGWNVVITHGNGPQVGFILRRSELAMDEVPPVPMDYAVADTQGAIGYMFQRALHNEFTRRGIEREAATIVTQILVDRADPAFQNPTKPVGSYMDETLARARAADLGWAIKPEEARGWRRVVPSPIPKAVIEIATIRRMIAADCAVIACGGGGIPVVEDQQGEYQGVEAVIDKDLASSLMARELGADLFIVSTAVEKVAINFNKPNQQWLDTLTLSDARRYYAAGEFGSGSMAPKVRAMIEFIEATGKRGIITDPSNLAQAVKGTSGTHVVAK
jgi:carbamate kinase